MASEGEDGPLVGRTGTLADVQSYLRDVGPGGTAAVFVTGESGVGKSRLLRETAEALGGTGFAVLSGTCLDIGDASPLHPVLQALRRHGSSSAPPAAAADDAGALLDRVSHELRAIAGDQRLLLVLDDLQWADRSTRQLLLYLLAGLGDVRISVLAAIRAEALHGTHPLRRVLAELRRLRSVRVVDLAPLNQDHTRELVSSIVGTDVAVEDAERVYKRSGGNPFVAEELARDLRDGRVELSDTLREIFLSRVDELPANAHAVVHALAAGVEPVDHAVLSRVVPLPEDQLLGRCGPRWRTGSWPATATVTACGTAWSPRSSSRRCCPPRPPPCTGGTRRLWSRPAASRIMPAWRSIGSAPAYRLGLFLR